MSPRNVARRPRNVARRSRNVDRRSELARTEGRNTDSRTEGRNTDSRTEGRNTDSASERNLDHIEREVTSWEGVTARRGKQGAVEFRLGRYVLGLLPLVGLVDERTMIERMRDAYERAQDALDRGAGVTV